MLAIAGFAFGVAEASYAASKCATLRIFLGISIRVVECFDFFRNQQHSIVWSKHPFPPTFESTDNSVLLLIDTTFRYCANQRRSFNMASGTDHHLALPDSEVEALNNSEVLIPQTTQQSVLVESDDAPIYEDINNYELRDPNVDDEADWSTTDSSSPSSYSEGDEGIECDLSSKRHSSLSISVVEEASAPSPYSTSSSYKPRPLPPLPVKKMPGPNVPKPGPAKLSSNAGPEEWLEEAKQCHYLPEFVMKQLCEIVKEHLMEGASPKRLYDLC